MTDESLLRVKDLNIKRTCKYMKTTIT